MWMRHVASLAVQLARKSPFPDAFPSPEGRADLNDDIGWIEARPLPVRRYGILFTPRSSSSRLTAIAEAAGLGEPGEFLNPLHMPDSAAALGALTQDRYVEMLLRRFAEDGTFGIEVTPLHVHMAYGDLSALSEAFGIDRWAWLVRRDIVAQAVSAIRMARTGIAHDDGSEAPPEPADLAYDGGAIRGTVARLAVAERMGERLLRKMGIEPLRLDYEGLTAMSPAEVARGLADWIGTDAVAPPDTAGHRKLPPGRSAEHAARFRAENRAYLAVVARLRAPVLRALPARPFDA